MKRRTFITAMGVAAGGAVAGKSAEAATVSPDEQLGVLVDLTKCIGCKNCEQACAEANGLPPPDLSLVGSDIPTRPRRPSARSRRAQARGGRSCESGGARSSLRATGSPASGAPSRG